MKLFLNIYLVFCVVPKKKLNYVDPLCKYTLVLMIKDRRDSQFILNDLSGECNQKLKAIIKYLI